MLRKSAVLSLLCLAALTAPPATLATVVGPGLTTPPPGATDAQSTTFDAGPNQVLTFAFNETIGRTGTNPSSGLFYNDFDDVYQGTGVNSIQYTLTGGLLSGSTSVGTYSSTTFSASGNESGGFVGFLGVDQAGLNSDVTTGPTRVATITRDGTGGSVVLGYITADYSVTNYENTTFTIHNTSSTLTLDPPSFGALFPIGGGPITISPLEVVPEPSTLLGAGLAIVGLAGARLIRRRKSDVR